MEYQIKIDELTVKIEMEWDKYLQLAIFSDHNVKVYTKDNDKKVSSYKLYQYYSWKIRFIGGIITDVKSEDPTTGMIYISRDEIIMRLPDGDYGLEFTSALPVDLRIGDNHITGLQGTIPVKAAAFPFDQRGQTVGTQVNAVSVKGSGNVIGNLNIVNGDFVKGNKYSQR